MKRPALVRGEYSGNGYEVWIGGRVVYSAGNHVHDSTQPALSEKDRLPLRTIRKFCNQTTREIAGERGGIFAGVERVKKNSEPCLPFLMRQPDEIVKEQSQG
jgi:hypothetical protein